MMITLRSSDKEKFEVDEKVLMQSQTMKHMIEEEDDTLPNITGKILAMVIEYLKKHDQDNPSSSSSSSSKEDSLKNWDAEFVKVDWNTLKELILAAHYLKIKSLLDLTVQTGLDMIRGEISEETLEMYKKMWDL